MSTLTLKKPVPETSAVEESKATESPVRERKKRTPVGGARDILTVYGKNPDYEYRWVIDSPGRVQRFIEGGWEVDTENHEIGHNVVDRGSKVGSAVTKASGDGRTLVLMRIPKEWYDEDQKAKQDRLDALEASMRADAHEGRYGSLEINRRK